MMGIVDDVSVADRFLPAMDKGGHTLIRTRDPNAKTSQQKGFRSHCSAKTMQSNSSVIGRRSLQPTSLLSALLQPIS